MEVRAARTADLEELQRIEVSAGERFRDIGMTSIADDPPPELATLRHACDEGRLWVAAVSDLPVGYALAELVGGVPHLEQLSVRPEHQGRGVGRALLEPVVAWARAHGDELTLTTFRDVPWNRALYEHLGFRVVDPEAQSAALVELRRRELETGLDRSGPRVVMARSLCEHST